MLHVDSVKPYDLVQLDVLHLRTPAHHLQHIAREAARVAFCHDAVVHMRNAASPLFAVFTMERMPGVRVRDERQMRLERGGWDVGVEDHDVRVVQAVLRCGGVWDV